MKKYVCTVCWWIYDEAKGDPDNGIAPGTKFEDLPADYVCPVCGAGKDEFEVYEGWLLIIVRENNKQYLTMKAMWGNIES